MATQKESGGCGKWALGCSLVLVVLLLLGGGAAWYGLRTMGVSFGGLKRLAEIHGLEDQVRNKTPYVVPDDMRLNQDQVEKLVAVQGMMKEVLLSQSESMRAKLDELERKFEGSKVEFSPGEAIRLVEELSRILVEAKKAQVDALNKQGLSVEEYRWIQKQAMTALGMPAFVLDVKNLDKLLTEKEVRAEAIPVHPDNAKLILPHQEAIADTLVLAIFGL